MRRRLHGPRVTAMLALGVLTMGEAGGQAARQPRGFCPGPDVETEPNDTPATATELQVFVNSPSRGIGGAISPAGDADYYRVTAQAGDLLWASVDAGRSSGTPPFSRDTLLDVFAADGATLLERDDDDGTANGRDLTIESQAASVVAGLPLLSSGAYVLRVSAKSPAAQVSPYTLLIGLTRGSASEQEPNDTPAQAQFAFAGAVDAALSSASDVDYYALNVLDAGHPFVVVDGDRSATASGPTPC